MTTQKERWQIVGTWVITLLIFLLIFTIPSYMRQETKIVKQKHVIDSLEVCLDWTRDSLKQYRDFRNDTTAVLWRSR